MGAPSDYCRLGMVQGDQKYLSGICSLDRVRQRAQEDLKHHSCIYKIDFQDLCIVAVVRNVIF